MIEARCVYCCRIETAQHVLPAVCPQCGTETPWRPLTEPTRDFWNPTEADTSLLRELHISPE